jgi:hypothetical protein
MSKKFSTLGRKFEIAGNAKAAFGGIALGLTVWLLKSCGLWNGLASGIYWSALIVLAVALSVRGRLLRKKLERYRLVVEVVKSRELPAEPSQQKVVLDTVKEILEAEVRRSQASKSKAAFRNLFRLIELFSRILPIRVRAESFEPAYNDEKKQYLEDRRRYATGAARRWLALCFGLHVVWIIVQCFGCMCSGRLKRLLLRFLPDIFRNLLGS